MSATNSTNSHMEGYENFDRLPEEIRRKLFPVEQTIGSSIVKGSVILLPGTDIENYTQNVMKPYTVRNIDHVHPGKHGSARNVANCVSLVSGLNTITDWISSTLVYRPVFIKGIVSIVDGEEDAKEWTGMVVDSDNRDVVAPGEMMIIDTVELLTACRQSLEGSEFNFSMWGPIIKFTPRNKS